MIRFLLLGAGMLLYGALRGFGVLRSGGGILPPWFIPGVALLLAVTSLRRPIVERVTMVLIAINAGLSAFQLSRGVEALSWGASGAVVVVLSLVFRREMQGSNEPLTRNRIWTVLALIVLALLILLGPPR